jgi:hypothetical protein
MGRVVDDRDEMGRRPMTAYLMDEGIISSDQAKEVKAHAERTGLSVRDAIVQLKMTDQDTAARAFASEIGRPYVDLNDLVPENDAMDKVPKAVVRRHNCLPLFEEDMAIVVACADEPESELEDEIRLRFNKPIRPVIAAAKSIHQAIATHYAAGMRKETTAPTAKGGKAKAGVNAALAKPVHELTDEEKAQRKQLGMILMCWSVIVPAMLDTFVFWQAIYRFYLPRFMEMFPYVSTILLGIPMAFVFYNMYVKPAK